MSPDTPDRNVDERFWTTLLEEAADHDGATVFDVRDDIERGRQRLRRTRIAIGGAGLMVGATILGSGLLLGGGAGPDAAVTPGPSTQSNPALSFREPQVTLDAPLPSATLKVSPPRRVQGLPKSYTGTQEWRDGVFEITASVLDPEKRYLNYDTNSMQGGSGSLGIKMGWTVPGQSGEGMVQLAVDSDRPEQCGLYIGATCESVTLDDGEEIQMGEGADGAFAVAYTQPDGETVTVTVDPLFGNNSEFPVAEMAVSKPEVYRLVQDERLDLP